MGGGSEKHATAPSAVAGPRTGPVCRAMYPVLIDSADQSVTESQDDSQVTLTEWAPVEHVDMDEEMRVPSETRIVEVVPAETRIVEVSFPLEVRIGPKSKCYV